MKAVVSLPSARAVVAILLALTLRAGAAQTVVSLNFDDNLGTQRIAQRVLNERGLKATFFVNTSYVGTSAYYLSLSDLSSLASQGHEIAGHTLTHQNLTALSSAEARRQVCDDRQKLINWGLNPVNFAYPVGPYNASAQAIVRDCGYASARGLGGLGCAGCVKAESLPPADKYGIRTPVLVRRETTLSDLQKFVTDAENAGGGLVPFIIHHICASCSSDSLTEANLTAFTDWLMAREGAGTVVRTMAQALSGAAPPAAPTISGLSPSSAATGGAAFTLVASGSGFSADAVVRWNGSARASSIINQSLISAAISAADVAAAGTATVTVAASAGTSNAATFTIAPAGGGSVPAITTLSPVSWPAGGSAFNLTVDGTGFSSGAVVRWNGLDRPGVLQGTTRLIVYIGPGDAASPGTAQVTVFKSGTGTSNALAFTVTGSGGPSNPLPVVSSLNPRSATAAGPAFTLTVDGTNFVSGAVVRWNGSNRATTFVGASRLQAAIGAADISAPDSASVAVFNPAPGGGLSNALSFTVDPSSGGGSPSGPAISAISPNSRPAGGMAFNLTVDGIGFSSGAVVRWNGSARTAVLQGTTRLIVYISPSDVASPGTMSVSASNPGSSASNSLPFTVTGVSGGGVPSITALSPNSRPAGGSAFNLTVDGSNYASGAVVRWNGFNRPGVLQGTSRLIVYIPSSDAASPGTAQITVFNAGAEGGTSNAFPFSITSSGAAAGPSPAASPEFIFGDLYAFPNPSRRGQRVTIRLLTGIADSVDVRVYDLSGRYLAGGAADPPSAVGDAYVSDFHWNVSDAGSGIYLYTVTARKAGHPDVVRTGRIGVLK